MKKFLTFLLQTLIEVSVGSVPYVRCIAVNWVDDSYKDHVAKYSFFTFTPFFGFMNLSLPSDYNTHLKINQYTTDLVKVTYINLIN